MFFVEQEVSYKSALEIGEHSIMIGMIERI